MPAIIAEFHYWDYGVYSQTAMESRPEIRVEELEKIAREFGVGVEVKKASASYFASWRIGWSFPSYGKIIVRVVGERVDTVRICVGRIFLLYGRPDEIPPALYGEKRIGKKIIDDLLREFSVKKRLF